MATTSGNMLYPQETAPLNNAFNGLYGEQEWNELQQRINDDQ